MRPSDPYLGEWQDKVTSVLLSAPHPSRALPLSHRTGSENTFEPVSDIFKVCAEAAGLQFNYDNVGKTSVFPPELKWNYKNDSKSEEGDSRSTEKRGNSDSTGKE